MADKDVGGIVGHLRLDKSDWDLALSQAGQKADDLARKNPNIKVTATTGDALAKLEAVAVATGRLQDAQARVSVSQSKLNDLESLGNASATKLLSARAALAKSTRDEETAQIRLASAYNQVETASKKSGDEAQKSNAAFSPLLISIAAIGPAIVPIAGAAVAAAGAFGMMGAAGLLAFKGIQTGMAQGTDLGQQYIAQLGALQGSLHQLEQTAAAGFLGSMQQAVSKLQDSMPDLNTQISQFTALAGHIGGNIFAGTIAGLHTLQPMFLQFGLYVDQVAAKFATWAQGGGFQKFTSYVMANLPAVERLLGDLTTTVSHLIAGFAPLGGTVVTELTAVSAVINAIPVGVLQALIPVVTDLFFAFKAFQALTSVGQVLDSLVLKLRATATAETEAGVAAKGADLSMSAMLGPIGAVITGVGLLAMTFLNSKDSTKGATDAATSYTQALIANNGVMDYSIRLITAKNLADSGAVTAANTLGISVQLITDAINGNAIAQKELNRQLDNYNITTGDQFTAHEKLSKSVKDQETGLKNAAQSAKEYAAAAAAAGVTSGTAADLIHDKSAVTASSMDAVAGAYNLTTQQANKYVQLLGISADELSNGEVSNQQYAAAIDQVQVAYTNATATGNAYLNALTTFSTSAGTAADKAALIGAALVNSQGDMLSYSGAIAGGVDATHALTISFEQQTKDVVLGIKSFRDTEKAAIDLKTGMIDLSATGAVPLIQQLQAMQTAAEKAAEAVYQHEVSVKGAGVAAKDASDTFDNMTHGSLLANAKQLGLTAGQAKLLADNYFTIPKDITSTVTAIGLSDVNDTLETLVSQLSILTKTPWQFSVKAEYDAQTAALLAGKTIGNAAPGYSTVPAGYVPPTVSVGPLKPVVRAAGGWINGPGTGTSDSVPAMLSAGEFVVPAANAARYAPMLEAMRSGVPLPAPHQSSGPQIIYTYVQLDGRTIAKSVNEVNRMSYSSSGGRSTSNRVDT